MSVQSLEEEVSTVSLVIVGFVSRSDQENLHDAFTLFGNAQIIQTLNSHIRGPALHQTLARLHLREIDLAWWLKLAVGRNYSVDRGFIKGLEMACRRFTKGSRFLTKLLRIVQKALYNIYIYIYMYAHTYIYIYNMYCPPYGSLAWVP